MITFDGVAIFTPFGTAGNVRDALTLTVSGGSGDYAGATGKIEVRGIGYNLLGPAAGPGQQLLRRPLQSGTIWHGVIVCGSPLPPEFVHNEKRASNRWPFSFAPRA